MKTIKKTLLILLLSSITLCNSDTNKITLTELQERQEQEKFFEFPQYTTDKYIYNKYISQENLLYKFLYPNEKFDKICITEKTNTHYFNNGITYIKLVKETINGKTIYTTETWITNNPSYITLTNTALWFIVISLLIKSQNLAAEILKIEFDSYQKHRDKFIDAQSNLIKNYIVLHSLFSFLNPEMRRF